MNNGFLTCKSQQGKEPFQIQKFKQIKHGIAEISGCVWGGVKACLSSPEPSFPWSPRRGPKTEVTKEGIQGWAWHPGLAFGPSGPAGGRGG
mmetsp:Transcript_41403/g.110787  ORF Transcript_41403/g.110787 Transcript_41403/m.110787 type:complete len:91 (+) Transcript_41403:616-888(+)